MFFDVKILKDKSIKANDALKKSTYIQMERKRNEENKEKSNIENNIVKKNIDSIKILEKFKILNADTPIYKKINSFDDITLLIDGIIIEIDKINTSSYISGIRDENTKKSLELMSKIIEKYKKEIEDIKNIKNTEELKTIKDIQYLFRDKIKKTTKKFFLRKVLDSIFKGLMANIEYKVYEVILKKVNKYLSYLGIETYNNIYIDKEVDTKYIDILTTKDTLDEDMVGKVSEIMSYPYIFKDDKDIIIYEGMVILYKKKGE